LFFFFVNNNVIENIKNRGSHKGASLILRQDACGARFILLRREIRKTGEKQEGKREKRGEIRFFIRKIRRERVYDTRSGAGTRRKGKLRREKKHEKSGKCCSFFEQLAELGLLVMVRG
jgi:hypothetical protein